MIEGGIYFDSVVIDKSCLFIIVLIKNNCAIGFYIFFPEEENITQNKINSKISDPLYRKEIINHAWYDRLKDIEDDCNGYLGQISKEYLLDLQSLAKEKFDYL